MLFFVSFVPVFMTWSLASLGTAQDLGSIYMAIIMAKFQKGGRPKAAKAALDKAPIRPPRL